MAAACMPDLSFSVSAQARGHASVDKLEDAYINNVVHSTSVTLYTISKYYTV